MDPARDTGADISEHTLCDMRKNFMLARERSYRFGGCAVPYQKGASIHLILRQLRPAGSKNELPIETGVELLAFLGVKEGDVFAWFVPGHVEWGTGIPR
jgi:hypothetical protein